MAVNKQRKACEMTILTYLDEIRKRCDAATPWPWNVTLEDGHETIWLDEDKEMVPSIYDLNFIDASRTDVDRLERALRVAVNKMERLDKDWWFEYGPETGVCGMCDCGGSGRANGIDGHDKDCWISTNHRTLAELKTILVET